MMIYRPDKFERLFHTHNGSPLWEFLKNPENILRMEVATYLGRPAIEPLSPALLGQFGAEITQTPLKQMIGHMVRQIMESRGFQLDRSGVRIKRPGNIFFSGSRYTAGH